MPFELLEPTPVTTGIVFASPHSGRDYPRDLTARTVLDRRALRSSEDAFMDRIVAGAPRLGAPLLLARTPRAYVDLNRNADELDPALVEGVRRGSHNPRVTSGLGVIPRVVANGRAIYRGKLTLAETRARLADHWEPYHATLRSLMERSSAQFGRAILVDCHSMPHEALEGGTMPGGRSADVVLGDRFGASADPALVDAIEAAFTAEGLRVARNAPFAGAYISQRYGRPMQGWHVVQVELDRALYMDEARIEPLARLPEIQAVMARVMARIVPLGHPAMPMAAE